MNGPDLKAEWMERTHGLKLIQLHEQNRLKLAE